ncbi:MAG: hypothetical protein KAQ65_02845 [Candidatus Thorarchaeota archaeon]|nr:hypothetical protein [Candidatus Thorarchaeota archaeon]MCK5239184.1 hypothetical protein [Candidatus Thorarchaeota archaeon]
MDKRRKEMERMAKLYMEYLNGPFGKKVLGRLKEGESFSLCSQYDVMKVTKESGKAVVRIENRINIDNLSDRLPSSNYRS